MLFPTSTPRIFKAERPSFTAELVNNYRAIATLLSMCDDPFAIQFADWDAAIYIYLFVGLRYVFGKRISDGMICVLAIRTNFMDDFIREAESAQVVILGAGLDARAYRLKGLGGDEVHFFEVDAPSTQRMKKAKVKEVFQRRPDLFQSGAYQKGHVTYVTCNFASNESFFDRLCEEGFNPKNPKTVILLEGVASYLTWEELKSTLLKVAQCAPGTRFVMNVPVGNRIKTSSFAKFLKHVVGEEWKFAMQDTDTSESLFGPLGFKILRELTFNQAMDQLPILNGERKLPHAGKMIFMEVK